jgi:hypothetical protein
MGARRDAGDACFEVVGRWLRDVSSGKGAVCPLRCFGCDPGFLGFFTAARPTLESPAE